MKSDPSAHSHNDLGKTFAHSSQLSCPWSKDYHVKCPDKANLSSNYDHQYSVPFLILRINVHATHKSIVFYISVIQADRYKATITGAVAT